SNRWDPSSASRGSGSASSRRERCASYAWPPPVSSTTSGPSSATLPRRDHLHLAEIRETAKRVELDLAHALAGAAEALGDLLERRLPAELHPERALGPVHLLHPLDDVDGHPDRPCLVRERPGDRLADPPGRVSRELVAATPVELLDGADEAERSFLDQIE